MCCIHCSTLNFSTFVSSCDLSTERNFNKTNILSLSYGCDCFIKQFGESNQYCTVLYCIVLTLPMQSESEAEPAALTYKTGAQPISIIVSQW